MNVYDILQAPSERNGHIQQLANQVILETADEMDEMDLIRERLKAAQAHAKEA